MNLPTIILAFISMIIAADADVTMSNIYYASPDSVNENVILHNMNYVNSVSIFDTGLFAESYGDKDRMLEPGRFYDSILNGDQSAIIDVTAENLGFSRSLSAGESRAIEFDYHMMSGKSKSSVQIPTTAVDEEVSSVKNEFNSEFGTNGKDLFLEGTGTSIKDLPGSFIHSIQLIYFGKQATMIAKLPSSGLGLSDQLAGYQWSSSVFTSQRRNTAAAFLDISVPSGSKGQTFSIKGQSQPPLPKVPDGPFVESDGSPNEIFMQYAINQSAIILPSEKIIA